MLKKPKTLLSKQTVKALLSILILLLFFGTVAYATTSGQRKWAKPFDNFISNRETPTDIAAGPRNISYVAGTSGRNLALIKYDSSGRVRWKRTYRPKKYTRAIDPNVEVDRWGNVYVAAYARYVRDRHILIVKYSPAGHRKWSKIYRLNWVDAPVHLEVGNRGNIYVSGTKRKKTGAKEQVIAKFNRRGQRKWAQQIKLDVNGNSNYNYPFYYFNEAEKQLFMKLDAAENIYVTIPKKKNYTTIKYGRGGTRKWVRHYNGDADSFDIPTDMQVDGSGNVYVTGLNDQTVGNNSPLPTIGIATLKYDTNGNRLWVSYYRDQPGVFTMAGPTALDKNGNLFITGFNYNSEEETYGPDSPELIIIKYDANGKKVWLRRNQKSWINFMFGSSFIARADSKGSVIITGYCIDLKRWDAFVTTMKYSDSGKRKWTNVERSDAYMYWWNFGGLAMTIDNKDGVLVTGLSSGRQKSTTIKYAP